LGGGPTQLVDREFQVRDAPLEGRHLVEQRR
jgi:hypothetical protein